VQTPASVLSSDELLGRLLTEPTESAQAAVNSIWRTIESCGLNNGKAKPPVKCFTSLLDAGTMLNGYYKEGVVFINGDLAPSGLSDVGQLPDRLLHVALEEPAHFVTGSTDSRLTFEDLSAASGISPQVLTRMADPSQEYHTTTRNLEALAQVFVVAIDALIEFYPPIDPDGRPIGPPRGDARAHPPNV
jgi:hypothetical protein